MKKLAPLAILMSLILLACSGECDLGYEGDGCTTEQRQKFIGLWTSNDYDCDMGNSTSTFSYDISPGVEINEILLTSTTNADLILRAVVTGNTFSIPPQDFVFGIDITYAGTGTFDSNGMGLTTTQSSGGADQNCTGTYTK